LIAGSYRGTRSQTSQATSVYLINKKKKKKSASTREILLFANTCLEFEYRCMARECLLRECEEFFIQAIAICKIYWLLQAGAIFV